MSIHVGLLSYPGSGNTWTRHLIQQLTGYCTGTVYCDKYLHGHGFPGECVFPNQNAKHACIVYKSHYYETNKLKQFHKAVILIRNPYDAFKAFFNWMYGKSLSGNQTTNRTQKAITGPRDRFHALVDSSRYNSTGWKEYVKRQCLRWQSSYTTWMKEFQNRFLLVRYRDLKNDLIPTLRRISEFLNVTASEKDLICTDINKEGQHHRKQKYELTIPDIFTEEQIDMVNTAIMDVMKVAKNKFSLKDFIFVNAKY
ncbi:sialate:O-sulfotransferase 1-like [Ylistrum balloti]|uniref:sialate:O-sulfotransferase 1-like n=1 Tax=Ylistrum balloti TaxID=509963 RepID=UPI002905E9C3|nr:sialate:O-sulfotransferase 1-like [Ylistrum balloti]